MASSPTRRRAPEAARVRREGRRVGCRDRPQRRGFGGAGVSRGNVVQSPRAAASRATRSCAGSLRWKSASSVSTASMSKAMARDRLYAENTITGVAPAARCSKGRMDPPVRELQIEHEKIEVAVGERALTARLAEREALAPAPRVASSVTMSGLDVEDRGRARAPWPPRPSPRAAVPGQPVCRASRESESVAGQLAASPLRIERDDHDRKRGFAVPALHSWMSENPS